MRNRRWSRQPGGHWWSFKKRLCNSRLAKSSCAEEIKAGGFCCFEANIKRTQSRARKAVESLQGYIIYVDDDDDGTEWLDQGKGDSI